jgi:alkanesulfonate monooxygenase SsuD/methylene tetrahydromethanopterin reductase-like flavin-dependent oxidoreductase (luciferase family)
LPTTVEFGIEFDTLRVRDLQPELNALSKRGDWAAMSTLVTDEMMETIAVHGTPTECARAILDRFGAWVDRVCRYFPFYEGGDDLVGEVTAELHSLSRASRTAR